MFPSDDFLLHSGTAEELYKNYAANLPIIDYHCHLSPKEIAENVPLNNIGDLWLGGDHYKWRAMRLAGIPEEYVTGNAPSKEKFLKWVSVLPTLIGCPLYHWSQMELKFYFGWDKPLTSDNAEELWNIASEILRVTPPQKIMEISGAEVVCTTDDPADSLNYHKEIAQTVSAFKVYPAFRPDKAMNIEKDAFAEYIAKLGAGSWDELKAALTLSMDRFAAAGCRASDHGLDYVSYSPCGDDEADRIFKAALSGSKISQSDANKYRFAFLRFASSEYAKRGWVMQLHYSCLRNNNKTAFRKLGADTGYDMISNYAPASELAAFLNSLNENGGLPKTILYSLNPNDNAVIDTALATFQDETTPYKIQHGAAWWFNDHKSGISEHLTGLANNAALPGFVGMLTDSRSFVSYPRHDYFRRILCDWIGSQVESGDYPKDLVTLGKLTGNISYYNVKNYFGF